MDNIDNFDDVLGYLEEARPLYLERKKERKSRRDMCVAAAVAVSCCLTVAFLPTVKSTDAVSFVLYDDEAFNSLLYEDSYVAEYSMIPLDKYGLLALN
jgi:hypothetical protein